MNNSAGTVAELTHEQMNWSMIVAFSGPGGVGKGTLVNLMRVKSHGFTIGQRATTRAHRDSDMVGEYRYFTDLELENFWEQGGLLERDTHFDVTYGLIRPEKNSLIVTDIDVDGSRRLFDAKIPRLVRIGVLPPGDTLGEQLDTLRSRMMTGGRSEKAIRDRLERAEREITAITEDWRKDPRALVVVNDKVGRCSTVCIQHVRKQRAEHGI